MSWFHTLCLVVITISLWNISISLQKMIGRTHSVSSVVVKELDAKELMEKIFGRQDKR